jgi:hypothetical protein
MKKLITFTIMVRGVEMAIDATSLQYDRATAQFSAVLVDENSEYRRLTRAIGDRCILTRWTDPMAKRYDPRLQREERLVGVDTMVLTWNYSMFSIHSVTPYIP